MRCHKNIRRAIWQRGRLATDGCRGYILNRLCHGCGMPVQMPGGVPLHAIRFFVCVTLYLPKHDIVKINRTHSKVLMMSYYKLCKYFLRVFFKDGSLEFMPRIYLLSFLISCDMLFRDSPILRRAIFNNSTEMLWFVLRGVWHSWVK